MEVHLIDGTYELFRHYHAMPSAIDSEGQEVAAVRGVLGSLLSFMQADQTYLGVATDHVIESFRNRMWPGYKDGSGVEPDLLAQFSLLEEALRALGVTVWAMEDFEADDALASAARLASQDKRVTRVVISTPDKDLAQCVEGTRVIQRDRRRQLDRDEAGVIEKFGVKPRSIPDYLALVGDAADGYPGLPGWGAKSAAAVLARFETLDAIPDEAGEWHIAVANPRALADTLCTQRDRAFLFRELATLRSDLPLFRSVDDLLWTGPTSAFPALAARFDHAIFRKRQTSRQSSKTTRQPRPRLKTSP